MNKVLCVLLFLTIITLHPGMTDENGGHYDRSTGEYHYHHGYPAHQHENGICPYDFDDKTGQSSGNPSDGQSRSLISDDEEGPEKSVIEILGNIFLVFVVLYCVYKIFWLFVIQPRLEASMRRKRNKTAYSGSRNRSPKIAAPSYEVPPFIPSPEQQDALDCLTAKEESVLIIISEIVSGYLDEYRYYNDPTLISAIAASFQKIKSDVFDGDEYTAKRIISRACYAYLLHHKKNNLPKDSSAIPMEEIVRMFQDTMQWLLKSGYYSKDEYNALANSVNKSFKQE